MKKLIYFEQSSMNPFPMPAQAYVLKSVKLLFFLLFCSLPHLIHAQTTFIVSGPGTLTDGVGWNDPINCPGDCQASVLGGFAQVFANPGPGQIVTWGGVAAVCGNYTVCVRDWFNGGIATATFSPVATLDCPANTTTAACRTQAQVNQAFANWINTASGSGGCEGVLTNNSVEVGGAPPACGGSVTVTFTYSNSCEPLITTCNATFTVASQTPLAIICPTATTVAACQTQAAINAAYSNWINTANTSGGCNVTVNNDGSTSPSRCGEVKTVTFQALSACASPTQTCQSTFTVTAPPPMVLTCPTSTTTGSCQTQAAVNQAFATWLATASGSGGCNGTVTNNSVALGGAPPASGGSRNVTFTYTSSCAPLTTTCQATFTVATYNPADDTTPPTISNCPNNQSVLRNASCVATLPDYRSVPTASDACPGTVTITQTPAPGTLLNGTVTVTLTATDAAGNPATTSCSFTATPIDGTGPMISNCPNNQSVLRNASCIATLPNYTSIPTLSDNCPGTVSVTQMPASGTVLNGTVTVTITATDVAGNPSTCTFTATPVDQTPPTFTSCPTGSYLGCNPAGLPTPGGTVATDNCGTPTITVTNEAVISNGCDRSQTRIYTATDGSAQTATCQQVFTWTVDPPVILTCASNATTAACQTQAQVDAAFANWLATTTFTGGCNAVLTNNSVALGGAPPACGGSRMVTFTVTAACQASSSCQATFTVASETPLVILCPTATTVAACQTQAAIDVAYSNWINTANTNGGCNVTGSNNGNFSPSRCGEVKTVTFQAFSTCAPLPQTCQSTFTVTTPPPVVLTCPQDMTFGSCPTQTQATVNAAFANWLVTASGSGGCDGMLTNNSVALGGAPPVCGGSRTVTFTYTSSCAPTTTTCQATFTVAGPGTFTLPANGTATAACPSAIIQPTPPTVMDACGTTLTPSAPVITNSPNPITCEGTRTYAFTYTDCAGHVQTWSHLVTVERQPFTITTPNGSATVACLALAIPPTTPMVTSNCGETIPTPTPTITDSPSPLACEGTRTYAYTYTDCEGNTATWSFVYTIERQAFTISTPNGSATVACPAQAVQPTPPTITSNCGEVLTPAAPAVTNSPNPLVCEGTRIYTWTYNDCEGNTATWSFTYTIEQQPFTISTPNGSATVDCSDDTDLVPTPPVVTSNCGEVLTPTVSSTPKNTCEGTRIYTFTYTDCEGNVAAWQFFYQVEYLDFTMPASVTTTVECPLNAIQPTPPSVVDNCGRLLVPSGPAITSTTNASGCQGSRSYAWTYTDCEGNSHTWSRNYIFSYPGDFFLPDDEVFTVSCTDFVVPPIPHQLYDYCGQLVKVTGPVVEEDIQGCSGWRKYSYTYSDCGGHSHTWSFTYLIDDEEPPIGHCPSGPTESVDETDLACIGDVPCPEDDFSAKVLKVLDKGDFYDVCSGNDLTVTLDSWTDLWQCSDADNDGIYTFGRTFYFRIADECGNEYPDRCAVTYSGKCQPLETFPLTAWGIAGDEPGSSVGNQTSDLVVIQALLNQGGPLVIGGGNRSLTIDDPQCVVDLLPGTGGPNVLRDCHQVNCDGPNGAGSMGASCNQVGVGGIKNSLAANAIALALNMRFNVAYNGLSMPDVQAQSLDCLDLDASNDISDCNGPGGCALGLWEGSTLHEFPYTLGGLLDMANLYLGGNLSISTGRSTLYAKAINEALNTVNGYWHNQQLQQDVCGTNTLPPDGATNNALPSVGNTATVVAGFALAPNPAGSRVTLTLGRMDEAANVSFQLYNQFGQLLLRKEFGTVASLSEAVDISAIPSGLYIASLKIGDRHFEQKLVVGKD